MVDPLMAAVARRAPRQQAQQPSQPDNSSILRKITGAVLSPISMIGNVLDIPASMGRDVLAGQNPFDQLGTKWWEDAGNRAGGREVLTAAGLTKPNDPNKWEWEDFAGFGAEVALDPLSWVSGGAGALAKGVGSAAKAAGLTNKLSRVARATKTPRMLLEDATKKFGLEVGTAQAKQFYEAAAKQGLKGDDLIDKPVGSWLKIHGPFGIGPEIPINNNMIAGALDKTQDYVSKSPIGRGVASLFDPTTRGAVRAVDQDFQRTLREFKEQFEPDYYIHGAKADQEIGGLRGQFLKDTEPLFAKRPGIPAWHGERASGGYSGSSGSGLGDFFATDNKSYAAEYGPPVEHTLDIKNPYQMPFTEFHPLDRSPNRQAAMDRRKELEALGHDSVVVTHTDGTKEYVLFNKANAASGPPTGPLHGKDATGMFNEIFRQSMEYAGTAKDFRGAFVNAMKRQGITTVPNSLIDAAEKTMANMRDQMDKVYGELGGMGYKGKPVATASGTMHFPRRADDPYLELTGEPRTQASFLNTASESRSRKAYLRDLPTDIGNTIVASPKYFRKKRHGRPSGAEEILKDFGPYLGFTYKKVIYSPQEHAIILRRKLKKAHKAGLKQLYEAAQPGEAMKGYQSGMGGHIKPTVMAIHDYMSRNVKPTLPPGVKGVTVGKAFNEIGLLRVQALQHLAKKMGISVSDLARRKISKEALSAITNARKGKLGPAAEVSLGEIGKGIDKYVTNPAKTNWTLPWVPFHLRNLSGGQINNATAGAFEGPGEALDYLGRYLPKQMMGKGRFRTEQDPGMLDLTAHDIVGQQKPAFMDVQLNTRDSMRGNPLDVKDSFAQSAKSVAEHPWYGENIPYVGQAVKGVNRAHKTVVDMGAKAAGMTEYYNRAPYAEYLINEKGYSPLQASREATKTQFDYAQATPFEKEFMKRVFPFYGFTKNQTMLTGKTLANHPGGAVAQLIRAQNAARDDEEVMPSEIANTMAMPYGELEDGTKRYLSGFGNPSEAAAPYLTSLIDPAGMMLDTLASTNPLIKYPAEMATNQTFFQRGPEGGGRKLSELDPTIGRILATATGDDKPKNWMFGDHAATRRAEHLLANTPMSKFLTTARGLTDTRKLNDGGTVIPGVPTAVTNALTPLKVTDVSPDRQERLLQSASNALADELGAGTWTNRYFRKEDIERARKENPALAAQMEKLQALWRESKRKATKKRQEKQKKPAPKDEGGRAVQKLLSMAGL